MARKTKTEVKVHRSPEEVAPALLQAHIDVLQAKQAADAAYAAFEDACGALRTIENEINEALQSALKEVQ